MSLKPKKVDFERTWSEMKTTIKEVITLGNVKRDVWNNRFGDVYAICVAYPEPLADRLYEETKLFLEEHVKMLLTDQVAVENLQTRSSNFNESLLFRYFRVWSTYSKGIEYLNFLFLYLNQQHIKKQKLSDAEMVYGNSITENQEQMEIGELGLEIWKNIMIDHLKNELVAQMLDCIKQDRYSSEMDPSVANVVNGVIQSFVLVQDYKKKGNLSLYQDIFESALLSASADYYQYEASQLLQKCTVSQYMEEVIKKLDEESRRALKYLYKSSIPKLRRVFEDNMITKHLDFLYSENFVASERLTDMKHLYILLKPIPDGLKNLIQTFLDHIKNEGVEIVSTLKGDQIHIQFVENLLAVHQKYEQLISNVFNNDPLFLSALDKACSSVINQKFSDKPSSRSAELVAKYCDSLLRKSKANDHEIEVKLTQSIIIFRYIEDKDIYQKFYGRMLAKRLIHEQSQSMDYEELMINKLKQTCGYEFTSKLHRMFTDINVSNDLNAKFLDWLSKNDQTLGINVSIKVLQQGAWPLTQNQQDMVNWIPPEFEKAIQLFDKFYSDSFSGRKLTWLHNLCQSELKISYLKKSYIITLQSCQLAILLLFETCDTMSCKEIRDSLKLSDDLFQKNLVSLLDSKLLLANTTDINDSTEITLNYDYSNKRTKFKITSVMQKDTPQEIAQTMYSIEEDRKLFLQATIVRIMKSRKLLRHNQLIQEILSQSKARFAPSITLIKKVIETLIDKQYIERTPNSGDEYSYIA